MDNGRRVSARSLALFALLCLAGIGSSISAGSPVIGGVLPAPFPLFPPDNWWNLDISTAPVDPSSNSFIAFINSGSVKRMHPDLGGDVSPGSAETYGMPYIVVDGGQPKKTVQFLYSDESDGVDHSTGQSIPFYPIPDEAAAQPHYIEGGQPGNVDLRNQADRHMLIVDRDNRLLYELYNVFYDGTKWNAGSGAFFDMKTNNRRPEGWTSSDAAGLAILPGLVRYDEVYGPEEIRHAFRCTVRATNGYVYPASHRAGSNPLALPMGARLRLKAGFDISGYPPEVQKVFRAMKQYGLIVADNGSDMYVGGTYDTRWNNDIMNPAFHSVTANDFEIVRLGYRPTQVNCFPHIAIGGGLTTVFSLVNTGSTSSSGYLYLYDSQGMPLEVAVGGGNSPASTRQGAVLLAGSQPLPVNLASGASTTIAIQPPNSGAATKSGWARVETDGGALSGVATFQYVLGGALQTIAGVFAAPPMASATIPVDNDSDQERLTGFAVANPNEEAILVDLITLNEDGTLRDRVRPPSLNPLASRCQAAAYLHEYLDSARKFRGSLRLVADGGKTMVVVALQQARGLYTAIPVVPAR